MATSARTRRVWDSHIVRRALLDALRKLHPRTMARNPVMFVVEVGSVLTSAQLALDVARNSSTLAFEVQITAWLWLTVVFANCAEAMAEGRGKAQADTLRKARTETTAQIQSALKCGARSRTMRMSAEFALDKNCRGRMLWEGLGCEIREGLRL